MDIHKEVILLFALFFFQVYMDFIGTQQRLHMLELEYKATAVLN